MLRETLETIGAAVLVCLTLWQIAKTRVEVSRMRSEMQPQVDRISHQVHPNGGSSMLDAITRIGKRVEELGRSIGGIRDDAREDRRALEELRADKRDQHAAIERRLRNIEDNLKDKDT